MNRRKRGTCNIEKTSGGRFRVRTRDKNGDMLTLTPRGGVESKSEAEVYAQVYVQTHAEEIAKSGITLDRFGEQFFANHARQVRQSTIKRDRSHWKGIVSILGKRSVSALKRIDIIGFRDQMSDAGLAPQTIRNRLNLLRKALRYACDMEILESNPAVDVRLPRSMTPTSLEELSGVLNLQEQRNVAEVIINGSYTDKGDAHRMGLLAHYTYALYSGTRLSEQIWQQWQDVSLGTQKVLVRYSEGGAPPKGGRPRKIQLIGDSVQALEYQKGAWPGSLLVFPGPDGVRMPENRQPADWNKVVAESGIDRRVTWHDLRHTCATSLLAGWWGRKWSLEEVRKQLGHASVVTTERYARLLDESLEQAGEATRIAGRGRFSDLLVGDGK